MTSAQEHFSGHFVATSPTALLFQQFCSMGLPQSEENGKTLALSLTLGKNYIAKLQLKFLSHPEQLQINTFLLEYKSL